MWLLLFYILTLSPAKSGTHEVVVCPPNNQLLITNNRSLLPLENVRASSESSTFPTENILGSISTTAWCTNASSFIGEHVNFTFTEPVVLTMILSTAFSDHYVSNFSIAYSSSEDGSGSSFDIYGITSMPQDFLLPSGPPGFFTFEESIVATRLQLVINDGVSATGNDTCWVVDMLGCTLSEAETVGPAERNTITREEVLAITLPTALGTIVVVILITAIGVGISVKCRRKEKQSLSVQTPQLAGIVAGDSLKESTLKEVHNVLYENDTRNQFSDTGNSLLRTETLRDVQNVLYGDNTRQEVQTDQTYELVPDRGDSNISYSGLDQDQQPNDWIQVSENESYAVHSYNELPREQ